MLLRPCFVRLLFFFLSVPASCFGRFRSMYGCPCQPAFLPSPHQCGTYSRAVLTEERSVLGGFRPCQAVLLGVVGMKEEVG